MDRRTTACLAAVLTLVLPAAARADEVRADRRELRQDRREVGDDRRDLAKLESLLDALDAARAKGDRRAILRIDTEVERELAAEARESRMEEALDRIELRRDRRELVDDRADRRGGPEARREARDDRRDLRDDRRDRYQERRAQARRDLIAREWSGVRGRVGPAEVAARRGWLLELVDLARQELSQDRKEIREDRRELREDRREAGPGRPERR